MSLECDTVRGEGLSELTGGGAKPSSHGVWTGLIRLAGLVDDGFEPFVGELRQAVWIGVVEGAGNALPPGAGIGSARRGDGADGVGGAWRDVGGFLVAGDDPGAPQPLALAVWPVGVGAELGRPGW